MNFVRKSLIVIYVLSLFASGTAVLQASEYHPWIEKQMQLIYESREDNISDKSMKRVIEIEVCIDSIQIFFIVL